MSADEMIILVVDDSEADRETIARYVQKASSGSIQCYYASSGQEGIRLATEKTPHIIFIDYMLPDITGLQVIERLTEGETPTTSDLIVVTGQGNEKVAVAAMKAGASDYLVKADLSLQALTRIVRNVAEKRTLRTDLQQHKAQADYLEIHDKLTGLYNRAYFESALLHALEKRQRKNTLAAVLLIDLDNFQNINDVYGHDFGDKVISEVARALMQLVDPQFVVARYSGDEFVVILENMAEPEAVAKIAKKIMRYLLSGVIIESNEVKVPVSIGIACSPPAGDSVKTLMQHVDISMHKAKKEGKSTYHFYTKELDASASRQLGLENQLHSAIERDELYLVYQPIVDLKTFDLVGFEALLRWKNAEFGLVSPDEFIPIAEQSYLMTDIGNWVLDHALTEFRQFLQSSQGQYKLSVNISSNQLMPENAVQNILTRIKNAQFTNLLLCFELTETAVISDLEAIIKKLEQIRIQGFGIHIDDFGTGNSSLTLLKKLPITALKIDKSFTDDVLTDSSTEDIVRSVVALCQTMELDNIVEGVETGEQVSFLQGINAMYGQGYFFSKPMPCDELIHYEQSWMTKHGKNV